tara:strand:+ start:377 stop:631 length:255 start_codon:yes stop_codon:yes gene_type:complete
MCKEAIEVLDQFYGDEYEENIHLYETDVLLEKLEGILENIDRWNPLTNDRKYVRLRDVIDGLRTTSKSMHSVMDLIYEMKKCKE